MYTKHSYVSKLQTEWWIWNTWNKWIFEEFTLAKFHLMRKNRKEWKKTEKKSNKSVHVQNDIWSIWNGVAHATLWKSNSTFSQNLFSAWNFKCTFFAHIENERWKMYVTAFHRKHPKWKLWLMNQLLWSLTLYFRANEWEKATQIFSYTFHCIASQTKAIIILFVDCCCCFFFLLSSSLTLSIVLCHRHLKVTKFSM